MITFYNSTTLVKYYFPGNLACIYAHTQLVHPIPYLKDKWYLD